jgi:ATP-dependent Clp protease ATP-binding subunit ClpA
VIQDELEHRIAEGILSGDFEQGSVVEVSAHNSEIRVVLTHE